VPRAPPARMGIYKAASPLFTSPPAHECETLNVQPDEPLSLFFSTTEAGISAGPIVRQGGLPGIMVHRIQKGLKHNSFIFSGVGKPSQCQGTIVLRLLPVYVFRDLVRCPPVL
jgi:hypothetical protein